MVALADQGTKSGQSKPQEGCEPVGGWRMTLYWPGFSKVQVLFTLYETTWVMAIGAQQHWVCPVLLTTHVDTTTPPLGGPKPEAPGGWQPPLQGSDRSTHLLSFLPTINKATQQLNNNYLCCGFCQTQMFFAPLWLTIYLSFSPPLLISVLPRCPSVAACWTSMGGNQVWTPLMVEWVPHLTPQSSL